MMDDYDSVNSDDPEISAILSKAADAESAGRRDDAIALYRKASDLG